MAWALSGRRVDVVASRRAWRCDVWAWIRPLSLSLSASDAVDVGLVAPLPVADDVGLGDPLEPCRSPRRTCIRLADGGRLTADVRLRVSVLNP